MSVEAQGGKLIKLPWIAEEDAADEVLIAERDAADTGERLTVEQLAESVGVDLGASR